MKTCPNCNSEVEDNFEICWNCQYSFTNKSVIEENEIEDKTRIIHKEIDCLRCHVPMQYQGNSLSAPLQ